MPDSLFRAWDVFLLRAPLATGATGLPTAGGHLEVLRAAAADARFTAAVTLATPSLGGLLARVGRGDTDGLKPAQLRRAALAVLRYDIRMRTRPTPFGLFAGVAGGRFGTTAKLDPGERHRTRTHADTQWLLGVVRELEAIPELLPRLRVRTHPALLRRGERVVLDCPSPLGARLDGETRAVVSLRDSPVVQQVLRIAAPTVAVTELAAAVAARFGVPDARVTGLVGALIGQEFLITNLRPPLDGGDPLSHVLEVLATVEEPDAEVERVRAALREVDARRREGDRLTFGEAGTALTATAEFARGLREYETPLHIDTAVDIEVELPGEVRAEVERAAETMWRMSATKLGLSGLRGYHERFLERYGADRLVPVAELLDPLRGLGAPGGYGWPVSEAPAPDGGIARDRARILLQHRLIGAALRDGAREVELTGAMVGELVSEAPAADVPNSCEMAFHVLSPSQDALAAGDFRIVLAPSPGSHHAGATSARFADLLSPEIGAVVAAESAAVPVHVRGAMRVDLAFLPRSGKAANLVHTVAHSGRRISVGLPAAEGIEEIPLADVAIGATTQRLCAVHRPTGREIVPVLANMISPTTQAPNVIRLLWEIGLEGQRLWEPWNWEGLADMPFVPRIRYGRCVLAPAVWRMDELTGVAEPDFAAAVARWRTDWRVPEQILAVRMDQRLLFDLTDTAHLELLWDELRKDPGLVAHEIPGADGYDGIGGRHREVVVPMSRRDREPRRHPHTGAADSRRTPAGLGSDWLFHTVHLPVSEQDEFIRTRLPELVRTAFESGCDRWFFIRYTDADGAHLRIRFHGDPELLWGAAARALGAVLDGWQHGGVIRAHRVDQYDPEIERYGGESALAAAERVFEADSGVAIRLLALADDPGCPHTLDTLAAVSVAALAHAFGAPDPELPEGQWTGDAAAAWLSRTGTRADLPVTYRADAQRLRTLIDPADGWQALRIDPRGAQVVAAMAERDAAIGALRRAVAAAPTGHGRLIGSLMHMTCNRLFGGDSDRERAVVATARGAVQDNFNRRRHTR